MANSQKYLGIFSHTLDCAISPQVEKHPRAIYLCHGNGEASRTWILMQLGHGVKDPNRQHPNSVGQLSAPFSRLLRQIGDCRYPFYLTPKVELLFG